MHKLLQYLRVEEDGELSITNLSLLGCVVAFLLHGLDGAGAAAFVGSLGLYAHRRYQRGKEAAEEIEAITQRIIALEGCKPASAEQLDGLNSRVFNLESRVNVRR